MQDALTSEAFGQALARIAVEAGRAILPYWRADCAVDRKRDGSPVTEADKAAEAVILAGLKSLAPGVPVLSEEAFEDGFRPDALGDRFFLVDPLDGTRAFVAGRDSFAVNIGLIDGGVPVAGAISAPARGQVWSTGGEGVLRSGFDGGEAVPVSARPRPEDGGVALVSNSLSQTAARDLAARHGCRRWEGLDSALKFCLIAEGSADVYPRNGPTMEWDTAAGEALIRAAGGRMTDLDGAPMLYGRLDRGLLNPGFVAAGRP